MSAPHFADRLPDFGPGGSVATPPVICTTRRIATQAGAAAQKKKAVEVALNDFLPIA